MPEAEDYIELTRTELAERLAKAERVCVLYGWGAAHTRNDHEKALYEAWAAWLEDVGGIPYAMPDNHPDIDVFKLARMRDLKRQSALGGKNAKG